MPASNQQNHDPIDALAFDDEALEQLCEEEEEEEDVTPDGDLIDDDEDEDEDNPEGEEEADDDAEDDGEIDVNEDDYSELGPEKFFEQAAGYREDFDWSQVSEEELARHEEILSMDAAELKKLRVSKMDALDRWAAAVAFTRAGMRDEFQKACRALIRARAKHDGLIYEDIYLELISDLTETSKHEEAFEFLDKFHKAFPDETKTYQRVRGLLMIDSGQIHEGKNLLDELSNGRKSRGEEHLEIGDELVALGHPELAMLFLERGKDHARKFRDADLITALDETIRLAQERIELEE